MYKRYIISLVSALGLAAMLWMVGSAAPKKDDTEASYDNLTLFANILAIVQDEYVEEVADKDLIDGALNGALATLDPHSHYSPPAEYVKQQKAIKRQYGGLGIEVTMEGGLVKVNHALEDGPAYASGIRAGDFITAVDGVSVRNKDLDAAVAGMRGLEGDDVTVTVLTPGQTSRDIVVTRAVVQGRAVRHRVVNGLGYIFIETFNNERLTKDITSALKSMESELGGKLPGLIIDMRGNRGGLLTQAISVSGLFLDGGEVLSARGRDETDTQRYHAEAGELYPNTPIAILVSSGSASAAEILAGALQDRGRGVVIGRRTFGKGSVQSVIPLPKNNGALRLTTQKYYTPSGKSIQGRGIMPDLLVSNLKDSGKIRKRFREDSLQNFLINPDETDYEERYEDVQFPPETWPEGEDYQLRKATDILKTSRYQALLDAQKTSLEK